MSITTNVSLQYNERSFTIDIISEINRVSSLNNNIISKAGGEYTVNNGKKKLFPDVILFSNKGEVLQGWEMKMPDTSLLDQELITNAESKARRLNLNTFLVCNGNEAALYKKDINDVFQLFHSWAPIGINKREDVCKNSIKWLELIHNILKDLNNFFITNKFNSDSSKSYLSNNIYSDFIKMHTSSYAKTLEETTKTNSILLSHIDIWWSNNSAEYEEQSNKFEALASCNLLNWLNEIFYCHYLKSYSKDFYIIENIDENVSINDGIKIFSEIWTLLSSKGFVSRLPGNNLITQDIWDGLIEINSLLKDFSNKSLPQEVFQGLIEGAISFTRRKSYGQYATNPLLAKLLCKITIVDKTKNVLDPCCGTGTIAKAALNLKEEANICSENIFSELWLGDVNSLPLQIANMAIMNPLGSKNIFQKDALLLKPHEGVLLISNEEKHLPLFHTIVSNLPFVNSSKDFKAEKSLGEKSDLYASIILHLENLLEANGRIGVIVSNSWLGTKWGKVFRDKLLTKFNLLQIINSSNGRWFSNSKVITNIIILEKSDIKNKHIQFISINKKIDEWSDETIFNDLSNHIIIGKSSSYNSLSNLTQNEINNLENKGIKWNAYFHDLSWINPILNNLSLSKKYFYITRGERGGCDDLFYNKTGMPIESQFEYPALMNSKNIHKLIANPDTKAFCCSYSIDELKENGFHNTLALINKFANSYNSKGKKWPEVLKKSNKLWYEQTTESKAHFVFPVNPDKRLFIAKLSQESLVNQRLGTIKIKDEFLHKKDFIHALLNSTIGLFLIEVAGFGRAEGALDLNITSLSDSFHLITPEIFTTEDEVKILNAFQPILSRDILTIKDELTSPDRINFDKVILACMGLSYLQNDLYQTFLSIFNARTNYNI